MKSLVKIILIFVTVNSLPNINIIPKPNKIQFEKGLVDFSGFSEIIFDVSVSQNIQNIYSNKLFNYTKKGTNLQKLKLVPNSQLENNEYNLIIEKELVVVKASSDIGYFYALQSLHQILLTSQVQIQPLVIQDKPQFKWRGLHLDVSRHFYSVDKIKQILDLMAFYKLNRFHWHLVDDQGWRIEIKKYPKLTQIGSVRKDLEGKQYGPHFYTQQQIKEIVNYAKNLNIEVMPEIEIMGHLTAMLAAYPHLSCRKEKLQVGNLWGVYEDVLCVGNSKSVQFVKDIIDEVSELFPFKYVHIGADECPKTRWKECEKCQNIIKTKELKNEIELQAYFVNEVANYLKTKNKQIVAWDEVLESDIPKDAVVMSWHGTECAEFAVRQGNPAIITARSFLYFDKYQSDYQYEPLAIGGYIPLKRVFDLETNIYGLTKQQQNLILGVQANIWTEHISTENHLDYMLYPRMLALAEICWNRNPDYEDFNKRLSSHYTVLDTRGVDYYVEPPQVSENYLIYENEELNFLSHDKNISTFIKEIGDREFKEKTSLKLSQPKSFEIYNQLPNGRKSKLVTLRVEKPNPSPALDPVGAKAPGFAVFTLNGQYHSVQSVENVDWGKAKRIKNIDKIRNELRPDESGAIKIQAYIKISKTGVYEFVSHADQLNIDDNRVLDCECNSKRIMYHTQALLEKGWHKLEAIFLVRDYLAIPKSKVKTDIQIRLRGGKWALLKGYFFE
jgi:hexosaminidase